MKTFSISDAVGEAFRIGFGRPLATLVWGLLMLLPAGIVIGAMIPMFGDLAAAGAFEAGADPAALEQDLASVWQFQVWSQLSNLVQLLTLLLVTTAIIRAVLAGKRGDGALFLRVGVDELHVAVVGVAVAAGAVLVLVMAALVAAALGFALWAVLPEPVRIPACVAMGLIVGVGFLLLWGRLALIAPATLRHRTFAFEQGWRLGRGQTGRLLLLLLVLMVVALLFGAALILLAAIVAAAAGFGAATAASPEQIEAWAAGLLERPGWLIGGGLALLLPVAWVQGFSQVLMTAPYARVVQVLAAEPAPREPISTDTPAEAH